MRKIEAEERARHERDLNRRDSTSESLSSTGAVNAFHVMMRTRENNSEAHLPMTLQKISRRVAVFPCAQGVPKWG